VVGHRLDPDFILPEGMSHADLEEQRMLECAMLGTAYTGTMPDFTQLEGGGMGGGGGAPNWAEVRCHNHPRDKNTRKRLILFYF